MFEITRENVPELLERCHGALMRIWNRCRDQMRRRGFETTEAIQEVAARVWENRADFRGTTVEEFCAWSGQILLHWMYAEQRRCRPDQMGSALLPVDPKQKRPSVDFQELLRWEAYQQARKELPDHERELIALRYEQQLSLREVGEQLEKDHPDLWQIHQAAWGSPYKLDKACQAAEQHLNKLARAIHRELEGGPPHECPPE